MRVGLTLSICGSGLLFLSCSRYIGPFRLISMISKSCTPSTTATNSKSLPQSSFCPSQNGFNHGLLNIDHSIQHWHQVSPAGHVTTASHKQAMRARKTSRVTTSASSALPVLALNTALLRLANAHNLIPVSPSSPWHKGSHWRYSQGQVWNFPIQLVGWEQQLKCYHLPLV